MLDKGVSEAWQSEEGLLAGARVVVLSGLQANVQTGLLLTQWGALVSFALNPSSVQTDGALPAQRGVRDPLLVSAGADVIITSPLNGLSAAPVAEVVKERQIIICQIDSASTPEHLIGRQARVGASAIAAALLAKSRGRLYHITVGPIEAERPPGSGAEFA